jgi:hypothetical protein
MLTGMMRITQNGKAAKLLSSVDDQVISCRGGNHDWPRLMPARGGKVPSGTRYTLAEGSAQGVYHITQVCGNCSRERSKLMAPGQRWAYRGGLRGFSADPGSQRAALSRCDYTNEMYRRIAEILGGA